MTPAVATPEIAQISRDVFSGLWDQSEDADLFTAYTSLEDLDNQSSSLTDTLLETETISPVYTSLSSPVYTSLSSPVYPTSISSPVYTSQSPASDYSVNSTEMNNPYYASQGDQTPPSSKCTQLALMLLAQSQGQNLSRAEEEKRRVRRERNKVAATKCREKRKAHSSYVRHEYSKVTDTTKQLEDQITLLRREKDELQKILQSHDCRIPEQPTVRLQQHQPPHQQQLMHTIPHYRQHSSYDQMGQR